MDNQLTLELLVARAADVQVIGLDRNLAERAIGEGVVVIRMPTNREAFLRLISDLGMAPLSDSRVGLVRAHRRLRITDGIKVPNVKTSHWRTDFLYAYRDKDELLNCTEQGWNAILRTFQVYPVNRRLEDVLSIGHQPGDVREMLRAAPFLISCADDGENMAHIVPLGGHIDGALEIVEACARQNRLNVVRVESRWFPPQD